MQGEASLDCGFEAQDDYWMLSKDARPGQLRGRGIYQPMRCVSMWFRIILVLSKLASDSRPLPNRAHIPCSAIVQHHSEVDQER